jgi:tRNA nucleotidyltransferase/poly(A) polymerase
MYIKNFNRFKKDRNILLETRVNREIPLPDDVIQFAQLFSDAGKEMYVVGGAIRDFLQGNKPKDFDIVTNASPEESKNILSSKFRVSDEQGKNFAVIRVFTKDEPEGYEIASFRKDIAGGRDTKGDDQKVEIGEHITIEDDVKRRDLTINSLFYDINKKEIVDLVGGIDDIETGNIRAVGNPEERFQEDRLRILRVFRFVARVNGKIDELTSEAIKKDNRLKGVSSKENVSQERIVDEMQKAYSQSKSYTFYLNLLTEFNMWEQIFPGVKINTKVVDAENYVTYLANLFKEEDTTKLEKKLVEQFKFDSASAMKIFFLVKLLELKPENVMELFTLKTRSKCDDAVIIDWITVNNKNGEKLFTKFLEFKPTVDAQEIIKMGLKGKEIGDKIKELEASNFSKMINT